MITAVRPTELKTNTKQICDRAFNGETFIISRPHNENVVILSEKEYQELARIRRNVAYLEKLRRGNDEIKNGQLISKTIEELEEMIGQ